jgi:hypothetical protein
MKKTILKLSIFASGIIIPVVNTNAQTGFQLGAQVIPQFSWLMNSDDKANTNYVYKSTFNAAFGITSQYGFNERMGIGLDVLYSFQGQRYTLSGIERYRRVDYLKIPLTYVNNFSVSERLIFFYKIGPQLGILTAAKLTDKDGNNIVSDEKAAYQNMEFGAMVSAGVAVELTEMLFLDASLRYDYGFTDAENKNYQHNFISITGNGGTPPPNRAVTNNSTLGLAVGLRCLLNNKR